MTKAPGKTTRTVRKPRASQSAAPAAPTFYLVEQEEDAHGHGAAHASPTPLGFWIYLMTDALIFATLFATYGVLSTSFAGVWRVFANTVPAAEQTIAYDTYVVPTSGRIFYQAALMLGTKVNVKARKQPLLVIAAEHDRTVTPYLARAIYNIQKKAPARTDFQM